ncbi:radical SAM protein [candidate division WOR-3 bacterium]|nr:radical SAM protein [candidate division WOR-3 bacterium]
MAGYPFVVVRISGCNLECSWCDTRYAFSEGSEMRTHEIISKIETFGIKRMLLTGGEPLLQEETFGFSKELVERGYFVAVETNGSLDIGRLREEIHVVMDFKLPLSGMHDRMLISNFEKIKKTDDIKFVVAGRSDFEYALKITKEQGLEGKANLLFSPVFGKVKLAELADWLMSSRLDARFHIQLHKIIWKSGMRGV